MVIPNSIRILIKTSLLIHRWTLRNQKKGKRHPGSCGGSKSYKGVNKTDDNKGPPR